MTISASGAWVPMLAMPFKQEGLSTYALKTAMISPFDALSLNLGLPHTSRLGMLENLAAFHGLVLDRYGAVYADALDSNLSIGNGCIRLGTADHTVVIGNEVEHVSSVRHLLN